MDSVTVHLNEKDGTHIKTIQIQRYWYVPPKIIINGPDFYMRESADGVSDPLEFNRLSSNEVFKV